MRTAIDTNVISSLWSTEPQSQAVAEILGKARDAGGLVVSAVVYAELSAHPSASRTFVDEFLSAAGIDVDFIFDEPLWREASLRFAIYATRRRSSAGGQPKRLPADFLVGSHALLRADRLITLDPARYTTSFRELEIVTGE